MEVFWNSFSYYKTIFNTLLHTNNPLNDIFFYPNLHSTAAWPPCFSTNKLVMKKNYCFKYSLTARSLIMIFPELCLKWISEHIVIAKNESISVWFQANLWKLSNLETIFCDVIFKTQSLNFLTQCHNFQTQVFLNPI